MWRIPYPMWKKKSDGRKRFRLVGGIYSRFFLLLSATLLPILLIQALIYYQRFEIRKQAELQSNLEIARGLATTFRQFVESVLAQQLAIGIVLTSKTQLPEDRIQQLLSKSEDEYPAVRMFAWMSPAGDVLYSSSPVSTPIVDSAYLRDIMIGNEWAISDLYIASDTGKPAVAIYRAFRSASGKLDGLVAAIIDPARLTTVFPVRRTSGRAFLIVDSSGRGVFREPAVADWDWKARDLLAAHPELQHTLEGWEQIGTIEKAADNVARIYALTPIALIGWAAGASIPMGEALAPVYSQLGLQALLFFFATLLAVGLSLLVARSVTRPLKRLRDHARALGKGETENPIEPEGPREFQILAHTLNHMANSLTLRAKRAESEHRRLQAAEEKIRTINEQLESKVRERTGKLTLVNEELKAKIDAHNRTLEALRESEKMLIAYTAKLEFMNKELKDFSFTASHDLQEPLRKIELFADLISKRLGNDIDEKTYDYLDRMVNSTRRARLLVKALLSYSRIMETEQKNVSVNLNDTLSQVMADQQKQIADAGADVKIGVLPPIEADPRHMYDLFANLISNALTYRRKNLPVIRVYSRRGHAEDAVHIFVEDNGIGFDEKYLHRIFRPFQRLHGRDEYDGVGIGLAICRKIVELHGGTITAKSALERGTTFEITFPLKQDSGAGVSDVG